MAGTLFAAAVASRTGKIIKNGLFKKKRNLPQNSKLHFVFRLSKSSEIVL